LRLLMSSKKSQRSDAHLAALADMQAQNLEKPHWQRATIQATFHKPSRRARLHDQDGITAWLKATADGIQDAGVVADDCGLVWLPPVQILGPTAGPKPKVVIVVTEIKE